MFWSIDMNPKKQEKRLLNIRSWPKLCHLD